MKGKCYPWIQCLCTCGITRHIHNNLKKKKNRSYIWTLPLSKSLLFIDSNVKKYWMHMKQLSFFDLQRQWLKHPCWNLHLYHIVFTGERGTERYKAVLLYSIQLYYHRVIEKKQQNSWNKALIQVFGCYLLIFYY